MAIKLVSKFNSDNCAPAREKKEERENSGGALGKLDIIPIQYTDQLPVLFILTRRIAFMTAGTQSFGTNALASPFHVPVVPEN